MDVKNIYQHQEWFEVMQTSSKSQTAVMVLGPGKSSGEKAESHENSEQTLLLVDGELNAEIAGVHSNMKSGDVVVIPAGVRHKFTNSSSTPAITFSVYCPPEYAPDEKG
jgi:mannose-6-phosphate isomerase-like protein (cupin superfamily)